MFGPGTGKIRCREVREVFKMTLRYRPPTKLVHFRQTTNDEQLLSSSGVTGSGRSRQDPRPIFRCAVRQSECRFAGACIRGLA